MMANFIIENSRSKKKSFNFDAIENGYTHLSGLLARVNSFMTVDRLCQIK